MNADQLTNSLNCFNCRELIESLLLVSRKERIKGDIHKRIIELNWPELLQSSINPEDKYSILYKYSLLFYVGSYVKYRKISIK